MRPTESVGWMEGLRLRQATLVTGVDRAKSEPLPVNQQLLSLPFWRNITPFVFDPPRQRSSPVRFVKLHYGRARSRNVTKWLQKLTASCAPQRSKSFILASSIFEPGSGLYQSVPKQLDCAPGGRRKAIGRSVRLET